MLELLNEIAWTQHGVFSRTQAKDAGVSSNWLSRHSDSGTVSRVHPGIYVLGCAPRTRLQTLMVHILAAGPGSVASGDTALALWCPELQPPRRPTIAAPRNTGYRTSSATIIRSGDLHLAHQAVIDHIPVAGVARALLDSAIECSVDGLVARINAYQRHSSLSFGALVETLHSHARRGRPGIATFRAGLSKLTHEVPDSEFERLVLRDLEAREIESPELHHVVRVPGEDPIELDLAWLDVLFDLELDGRDHLTRMSTARRDRQRDRILQRQGFTVARYVWDDYIQDRDSMMSEIASFVAGTKKARARATG